MMRGWESGMGNRESKERATVSGYVATMPLFRFPILHSRFLGVAEPRP